MSKSPSRLEFKTPSFLSPRRRRTTLGSPSRQANPALSPMKSNGDLAAAARVDAAYSVDPGTAWGGNTNDFNLAERV